jgi:hypothetical protein
VIDGRKAPLMRPLDGLDDEGETLSLLEEGNFSNGIYGWNFKYGATGMCPVGDGYFYLSENRKDKKTGEQASTLRLYRWTGAKDLPFVKAGEK